MFSYEVNCLKSITTLKLLLLNRGRQTTTHGEKISLYNFIKFKSSGPLLQKLADPALEYIDIKYLLNLCILDTTYQNTLDVYWISVMFL